MVVPRQDVAHALESAEARVDKEVDKETASREAFRDGELGLDRYGLRTKIAELGVRYVTAEDYGL